jgi:hypothetical protein
MLLSAIYIHARIFNPLFLFLTGSLKFIGFVRANRRCGPIFRFNTRRLSDASGKIFPENFLEFFVS